MTAAVLPALKGAPNFRDVGGLPADGGRKIRAGRVLRSGHLGVLDGDDLASLRNWLGGGLTVVDLRGAEERVKRPCLLDEAVVHSLPIEPRVAAQLDAVAATGETPGGPHARRFMCEAYGSFARDARPQLAQLFRHLLARGGQPLLVHCAAGKDRTGFMVAMVLAALGVPRDVVMEDYLLTNQRVTPRDTGRFTPDILHALGTVYPEYLQSAWAVIDGEFGGIDSYLENGVGLSQPDREALRAALLDTAGAD